MKGLTPKQKEILDFITLFIEEHHYSPTYREIIAHFSFTSPGSVYKHIRTLEKKGALTADKQAHRSIRPITEQKVIKESTDLLIPLIGNLSIGYPLELFSNPQTLSVPASLVHSPDNTYLLQVQGDSLHDEGIHHSDLLLIEARGNILAGELILGLINQHDSILRRYYPEGHYIRLESQNKHTPSYTIKSDHIMIQGVLVGLIRMY